MSTSGMVANTSVTVNSSHADGKVEFNITAFDLAGNSLTVTHTNRSHKSNSLKSNHIQQQRPQHLTCNLG